MSRSILLQLARDSITEVLKAQRLIQRESLLEEYPLLDSIVASEVKIYCNEELRSSCKRVLEGANLLDSIVYQAKKAAFEETQPLQLSEYLLCEIEIVLQTPQGEMRHKDKPLYTPQTLSKHLLD